jgi:hypothetical protein
MKTKALSLTLAGMMSIQSIGFAQQADRTAGIGDQAISTAKNNLQALNNEVLLLDQALANAAESISLRDSKGGITNGAAVVGAGIGVGLSAMSYLAFHNRAEGSGIGGLILAAGSIGASALSLLNGGVSHLRKTKVETAQLEQQLIEAQKNVEASLAQSTDKAASAALTQMGLAIKNTQSALASYKEQESEITTNRLVSQAAQVVGAAVLAYGITQKNSNLPLFGLAIMNIGNIGAFLSGLQDSEAQEMLKEIQRTRDSLKIASAALQ